VRERHRRRYHKMTQISSDTPRKGDPRRRQQFSLNAICSGLSFGPRKGSEKTVDDGPAEETDIEVAFVEDGPAVETGF